MILLSVISSLWCVDLLSMGSGSAQSSSLNCIPSHLGHLDPFHICQRQLSMAYPCISITATTPLWL